jgi:hypothetical protein
MKQKQTLQEFVDIVGLINVFQAKYLGRSLSDITSTERTKLAINVCFV